MTPFQEKRLAEVRELRRLAKLLVESIAKSSGGRAGYFSEISHAESITRLFDDKLARLLLELED